MFTKQKIICFFILLLLSNKVSFADEKSHYEAASKFLEVTFNEKLYHDNAMRYALLAVKDKCENDPKTKPYSDVIINTLMEVMEAYINDIDTQKKVKTIYSKIYKEEFSEYELREMLKFYRTNVGQKYLLKLPVIMEKQWELETQIKMSPKYERILEEKVKALQERGILPKEFK
jgi:hypothetical protein